jgi:hypothetical protein
MELLDDNSGITQDLMVYLDLKEGFQEADVRLALGNLPDCLPENCTLYGLCSHAAGCGPVIQHGSTRIHLLHQQWTAEVPACSRARWLQDPFLSLLRKDAHGVHQAELLVHARAPLHQLELGMRVAAATGRSVRPVDLRFAGGNLLRIGDTLLVGLDLAYENGIRASGDILDPSKAARTDLEENLKTLTGCQKVCWVGLKHAFAPDIKPKGLLQRTWQPLFHLDLFLMPGGRSLTGQPRLWIGEPYLLQGNAQAEVQVQALRLALAEVEDSLREDCQTWELARLPLLLQPAGNRWEVYSLCNGWIDHAPGRKVAYLPDFRAAFYPYRMATEAEQAYTAAEEALAVWGFSARFVQMNLPEYANDGGALHCAVKVLSRT